jgi:hypothetical protein
LVVAHIVPAAQGDWLGDRKFIKTAANAMLFGTELETAYDDHEWSFDPEGTIHVFFENSQHKELLLAKGKLNLDFPGFDNPSPIQIKARFDWSKERAKQHCPDCWELKGVSNIERHRSSSCDRMTTEEGKGRALD